MSEDDEKLCLHGRPIACPECVKDGAVESFGRTCLTCKYFSLSTGEIDWPRGIASTGYVECDLMAQPKRLNGTNANELRNWLCFGNTCQKWEPLR